VEDNRQTRMDAQIKKSIDARTREFKEKLAKLTYAKIKQTLVPSPEPLKGYPHNESLEENSKEYQKDMDMIAGMIKKGEHKRVAGLIKRTAALKGGGGWNLTQKPSKAQKDQYNKMVSDHKKKHRALYASYNEEAELEEMNARYEISDMEQSKDPEVKKQYAKLKKAKYPSIQYIRQYKEVEAALDKSLPANKRKK